VPASKFHLPVQRQELVPVPVLLPQGLLERGQQEQRSTLLAEELQQQFLVHLQDQLLR
jgi:hypothetical protein